MTLQVSIDEAQSTSGLIFRVRNSKSSKFKKYELSSLNVLYISQKRRRVHVRNSEVCTR